MKSSGFKPNPKMSGKGDMGGDGRKHKRIEKAKYADGGTVTYTGKKNIKIGKGRPLGEVTNKPAKLAIGSKSVKGRPLLGEVTNKPPKFDGGRPDTMNYIGGSKDFDESTGMRRGRPGGVTKIGIGGGGREGGGYGSGAVGNETRTGRIGGGGGTYNEPPRRNPPALGQLPLDGSGGGRNPPALGLGKLPKGGISGGPTRLPPGMKAPMMKKKGGMAIGLGKLPKGGISGGPTRVGPKPMPSNPLNRGPISRMKKGGYAKGRKGC